MDLLYDAQTSGGLLIAIPQERLEALRQALARRGAGAFVIGRVIGDAEKQILLTQSGRDALPRVQVPQCGIGPANIKDHPQNKSMNPSPSDSSHPHDGCCADLFPGAAASSSAAETQKAFGALIRSVQAGGVLSEKAK